MEIVYNVDSAALYSGGKYKLWENTNYRKALCEVDGVNSIDKCTRYASDLNLQLPFRERFLLSCL